MMPGIVKDTDWTDELAVARLAAIIDSSFDAIVSKNLDGIITSWNGAAERLFGYTAEEAIGQSIYLLIPDEHRDEEVGIISKIKAGERLESYETVRRRKDGSLVSVSLTVSPVKDRSGRIVGASKIARDITPAKESERRIRMLLREINHRVKNQYAVILSIIRETGKRSSTLAEFEAGVRTRIMALASAHDLLVSTDWTGASMAELVQDQLRPFGHEERVSVSGPLIRIHPNAVQPLSMAFHELCTNSSKYGALAHTVGEIAISWGLAPESGGRAFHVRWEERSEAIKAVPAGKSGRSGFGSVVLLRVAPQALDGRAELTRDDGCMTWSLTAPLVSVMAEPPAM